MPTYLNISAYRFTPLTDLKSLRLELQDHCKQARTKGTILLSTEGINLFVAGETAGIESLLARLRLLPGLETLTPKVSESDHQPFQRMLVRIKKEIIAFGVPGIDPAKRTAPKISPRELKAWLDEGRELTLLDTRNEYEIKLGTFEKARSLGLRHFRDFPKAAQTLDPALKTKPLVMFCTGGIRCEKAGPYLEMQGFQDVLQLDGGILKYFEECGNEHYTGNCFVFDQRVGVDPSLQETSDDQCFACLTPLTPQDQQDSRYEKGVSCRYCFKTSEQRMRETIDKRHAALSALTDPLPGAAPYDQKRPVKVPAAFEGYTLFDFLVGAMKHVSPAYWATEIDAGRILTPDHLPATRDRRVTAGERYFCLTPQSSEPPVNAAIRILFEDEALIVLEKPAPLPMHPCGRYNRNTLQFLIEKLYAPQRPHVAHRLDADTTGIVLLTRTRHFAGLLQPQFSRGEVEKIYLARVHGHPPQDAFDCELPVSAEVGEGGVRVADAQGDATRTEFRVVERLADGTALLEAKPITGRTNQIRIHLWELGHSIVGDPRYLPNRALGDIKTNGINAAPLCLRAMRIAFHHPLTRQRMEFSATAPHWAVAESGLLELQSAPPHFGGERLQRAGAHPV